MSTALDIIDGLNSLDYKGNCTQIDVLQLALEGGFRNEEYRKVVLWLTNEIHSLRKTDEKVSADVIDTSEFAMELSAMLKELSCPYTKFIAGPLSDRFDTPMDRLHLLEFLITELMTSKMSLLNRPKKSKFVIEKNESNTAKSLERITRDLSLGKPPENISPKALFDKMNFRIEELLRTLKPGILNEPLLRTNRVLTDKQWKNLEALHADLDAEYNLRRQVLLTRLECTIQSFKWSDRMKSSEEQLTKQFQEKFEELEKFRVGGEDTNIVALLAARDDLAIIEKTSSANVRKNTSTEIQKHIIGRVPDRGGRAYEHAPPPPEMPSWQQQRASGPAGGGGGFSSRGGNFNRGGALDRGSGNRRNSGGGRGGFNSGSNSGGSGGSWQQYSSTGQQQQNQSQSQQHYQQNSSHQRDQNWISGSGRVQGARWSQKGGFEERSDRYYNASNQNNYNNNNQNYNKAGDNNQHYERSHYQRGGGGGGGRR